MWNVEKGEINWKLPKSKLKRKVVPRTLINLRPGYVVEMYLSKASDYQFYAYCVRNEKGQMVMGPFNTEEEARQAIAHEPLPPFPPKFPN
jgi:hypothetical protein